MTWQKNGLNFIGMSHEPDHSNEEERLEAENDFLKMKIMLEQGAEFYGGNSEEKLPPEIENEFLKNIVEFEKHFDKRKTIKILDRIGRPEHFKPIAKIPDIEIDREYQSLLNYLERYEIHFSVCSPNIPVKELYRFITEELFEYEMDDIRLPGWTTNFIYDEFYPDPYYDNARDAEDCVGLVLRKEPLEFMYNCRSNNLQFNNRKSLSEDELKAIVNRFKLAYNDIETKEIKVVECLINENESSVKGSYDAEATINQEIVQLSGKWQIFFEKDVEIGYWYINRIQIEVIDF